MVINLTRIKQLLITFPIIVGIYNVATKPANSASFGGFEDVIGIDPQDILSDAQGKIESQIQDLLGPISELLAIDPSTFVDDILSDLNLEDLDVSNIYGDMNIPNPNKLLEELQSKGTDDFTFGIKLGSSVKNNKLLTNEAAVELTGQLAKSMAESSAFSNEAQEKMQEKLEFGAETTTTAAELAAATQNLASVGQDLVTQGEGTDVTQEIERLQLKAQGLQLQAESTQSSQLSLLAAQQAAIYTETQQSRIDDAMRNQILSDISKNLQSQNAGGRVEKSTAIRALANGSQFPIFNEP
ncbi:MAG: hypothetical protein F6K08_11590 [Okeania sp. SIO1H6]|nr:hypothetical protein [Okeania sp. SIO1H6]